MKLVTYPVVTDEYHERFEFLSEGVTGTIKKVVFYQEIADGVYNLSFGDWQEPEQKINDKVRSNNNDREKVLATIALTVLRFMDSHPGATVLAKGSTPSRTRLYQIGICNNRHVIDKLFVIEGWVNHRWEPFTSGKNYEAFILQRR